MIIKKKVSLNNMTSLSAFTRFLFSDSLKARCAKGSISLTAGTVVAKLIAFAKIILLAKLLISQELGVMIIILPLVTFFETLTEIGIKQSVIQHKDGATEPYLNMAWWIQAVRGVILYLAAFFLSPLLCHIWIYGKEGVAALYTQSELLWMVRLSFLTILFNGFISPRSHVLMKEFRFAKSVLLVQGSAILSGLFTIVLTLIFRNVWAFVIGTVSNYFFLCVLSYVMCPFRPKRQYDSQSFHALIRFSKGMFGLPILTYLAFYLDVLIGSLFVSPGLIGMYGVALILARTPREVLTRIFGPLLIPAFAEKQDDLESICRSVTWMTKGVSLLILPLTAYMIIYREALLTICYKPEFTQVATPFSLLCLTYLILIQGFPIGKVFFGLGEPGKHRAYVVIRFVLLVTFIWPVAKSYGILGISLLLLISNAIAFLYQVYSLKKAIGLNLYSYWVAWVPGFAISVVLAILLIGIQLMWPARPAFQLWIGGGLLVITLGAVAIHLFIKSKFLGSVKCQS